MIFLTSCATTNPSERIAEIDSRLAKWIGKTEYELVQKAGIPTSIYEMGNTKILSYKSSKTRYETQSTNKYFRDAACNGPLPGYCPKERFESVERTTYCEYRYTIEGGIIKSTFWEGNYCG